jgi:hypothetical protein
VNVATILQYASAFPNRSDMVRPQSRSIADRDTAACNLTTVQWSRAGKTEQAAKDSDSWTLPHISATSPTSIDQQLLGQHALKCNAKPKLCYDSWSVRARSLGPAAILSSFLLNYLQRTAGLFKWDALFDERTGMSFPVAAVSWQRSGSRVRVMRNSWPYFTASNLRRPKFWGSGSRLY